MADIYSEAKGSIVWLGSEYDGSVRAMSTLNALGSETKVDWPTKTITPLSWEDHHHWINWIWQEVCLARNTFEMRCGYVSMV